MERGHEPVAAVGSLPTGTVTFLFTDMEGSTALLQRLPEEYPRLLAEHHRILQEAVQSNGGVRVNIEGDGVFAVFPTAAGALEAAVEAQRALSEYRWPAGVSVRVRMGVHTGEGRLFGHGYVGIEVHRGARIVSAGHGGQILLSEPTRALAAQSLPNGVELQDLGKHRLKDFAKPEQLYQAAVQGLPSDFPALRTLDVRATNLPAQLTSFVGREGEVAHARDLLITHRLITFTGPGGTGKTRLSLEVAMQSLDDFPHGVFFVPLASITDPALVPSAIARAVGVEEHGERSILEVLRDFLDDRDLLLVLDNFEQVMEAASVVSHLLAAAPKLRMIVTTREVLHLSGEQEFPVPPLSLPSGTVAVSPDAVADHGAVRLFIERAREARPGFELTADNAAVVAEICARLDGLPLAIELAAARLRLFSPDALRDRLRSRLKMLRGGPRDLPARQQTLRSTMEWSYDLLDTEERVVFRLLSLFSSASVGTVEEVVHLLEAHRDMDVVDRLASLVDKSLVRVVELAGRQRLSMLETIREYATERLEEDAGFSEASRRAHAEVFCEFAQARRDSLDGPQREDALEDLASEIDNLQVAWRFWVDARDLEKLETLLDSLWVLLEARGWYHSAAALAKDLLGVLSTVPSTPDRAQRMITLATSLARGLLAIQGYTDEVEEAYTRALALLHQAGRVPERFPALRSLASFYVHRAEFEKAAVVGRELLDFAEEQQELGLPDVALQMEGHLWLGVGLVQSGGADNALYHLERAVALYDPHRHESGRFRLGPNPGVVSCTTSAFLLWSLGHPERALERAARGLELATHLNHPFTLAYALFHVGFFDLWRRELGLAQERASSALDVAEEYDYQVWRALALVLQGVAMTGLGRPEEGLACSKRGLDMYQGLKTPPVFWPFVLSLRAVGLALGGRPAEALKALDQAMAVFTRGDANVFYPEFLLLKGDLLLALSGADAAEPWYQNSLEAAGEVGARMTQLRAATRLVRLPRTSGKRRDATEMLRRVYESFTEGVDTPDLVDARTALDDTGAMNLDPRHRAGDR